MRVLVIEDNADIAANIVDFLDAEGFTSDLARDGISGMHLALTGDYDAMVLDLGLPGMDGLALCRKLREHGNHLPILMLTARDTLPDKLAGFGAGTDDYLVKPFALPELVARLNALTARGRKQGSVIAVGDLEMDLGRRRVRRGSRALELNNTCYRILEVLVRASPNLVTRDELTYRIWGDQPPGSDALRSHIYALRREVDKPDPTALLQTVRGVGWRLVSDDEAT